MLIQNCSLLTGKVSLLCQRQTTRRSWPESSRLCIPLNANPSAWRSCLRKLIGRREYNPPQVLKPNPSCCLSSPRLAQKYYAETPPKGPVKYNLQKYAWAMDPIEGMDNSYTMTSADGLRERVFVDPTDAIRMIRAWMRSQQNHFRMPREYPASRLVSNSPRPLIVNGPTKTGKTFFLNKVLPSIVALDEEYGINGSCQLLVLKLDGQDLAKGTAKRTMSALLEKLVTWALENNVPVEECVWSMTAGALNCILEDEAADGSLVFPIDDVEDTILTFLYDGVKCPMLVLFDNMESILLPKDYEQAQDLADFQGIRTMFIKRLLLGPPHVMWVCTGSSMALIWQAIASCSSNGRHLSGFLVSINLPISVDQKYMDLVEKDLGRRLGFELPEELVRGSEPTPACLSVIAVNYAAVRPGDLQQFLQNFRRTLVAEVKAEWAAAFFVMSGKESSLWGGVLRGLCAPGRGVPGELKPAISKGIVLYLEQYLHRNPYNDRLYLGPSWYRYILEMTIKPDAVITDYTSLLRAMKTASDMILQAKLLERGSVHANSHLHPKISVVEGNTSSDTKQDSQGGGEPLPTHMPAQEKKKRKPTLKQQSGGRKARGHVPVLAPKPKFPRRAP